MFFDFFWRSNEHEGIQKSKLKCDECDTNLQQCLTSEDVFDLRRTNAKGQSAKCSVGGCVRVSAHNSRARQGEALLGPNNMNDALSLIGHSEIAGTIP